MCVGACDRGGSCKLPLPYSDTHLQSKEGAEGRPFHLRPALTSWIQWQENPVQVRAQSIKAPQQGSSPKCTEMMPSKCGTARLPSL